jgi:hypothetical protein
LPTPKSTFIELATNSLIPKPLGAKKTKVCVSHCGLAIYIKKYLKAKEELWKLKIFHHAKI